MKYITWQEAFERGKGKLELVIFSWLEGQHKWECSYIAIWLL